MKNLVSLIVALSLMPASAIATPRTVSGKPNAILAAGDRNTPGGRAVKLTVQQTEIATTIDLGRIASAANGGGLLGVLIIEATDKRRETMASTMEAKAAATARPLRAALLDLDIDALALATTKAALATPAWFQPASFLANKDPSLQSRAVFMASTPGSAFAFVEYHYELSPDFSQIRLIADIELAQRTASADHTATGAPPSIYRQRVSSIVQLDARSYEPHENVARWSADGGKLAKAGLTAAFDRLRQLIPYALELSQTDIANFTAKNREKAFAAGYYGPLIVRNSPNPEDILLWSDGLVFIRSIR